MGTHRHCGSGWMAVNRLKAVILEVRPRLIELSQEKDALADKCKEKKILNLPFGIESHSK